ncbi:MAG: hypothetical protein F4Y50_13840 [Dehalococcoidia bacterium]|nr:hypothetical protein [Dehalococcoidia bacterium]
MEATERLHRAVDKHDRHGREEPPDIGVQVGGQQSDRGEREGHRRQRQQAAQHQVAHGVTSVRDLRRATPYDRRMVVRIQEGIDSGQLSEAILRDSLADAKYGEPPGTGTMTREITYPDGGRVALTHELLRPDGSLGA